MAIGSYSYIHLPSLGGRVQEDAIPQFLQLPNVPQYSTGVHSVHGLNYTLMLSCSGSRSLKTDLAGEEQIVFKAQQIVRLIFRHEPTPKI